MNRERRRPVIPSTSSMLSRGEKIRMAVMAFVLLAVLASMLGYRAQYLSSKRKETGRSGSDAPKPVYVVPVRPQTPDDGTEDEVLPPPIPEDAEISYQNNRDEVLEAFEDLKPVPRTAPWWTLAARLKAFGYPIVSRLTPRPPDLTRCIREPDMCHGDVIRFEGRILSADQIDPPADYKGAPVIQNARVLVDLPDGPREVVIDFPVNALPPDRTEAMAMAGIFVGFLPPAETPPDTAPGAEPAAKRPYLIGLFSLGNEPAPPPVPPTPDVPAAAPAPDQTPPDAPAPPDAAPPDGKPVRFEGMLGRIRQDGKYEQDEAYNYFIRYIHTADPKTIAEGITRNLSATDLLADPAALSGEFVRVRGTLLDVYHQGLETNPVNLRDSYIAYVLDPDENVTVVHLLEKPPPFLGREDILVAEGIFLKILHYETQRMSKDRELRVVRKSPLVLARTCRVQPVKVESRATDAVHMLALIGILVTVLAFGLWLWMRRTERPVMDLVAEARKQRERKEPGSPPASPSDKAPPASAPPA